MNLLLEELPDEQFRADEFMMLYSSIHDLCINYFPPKKSLGPQVYDRYKKTLEEYINVTVLPALKQKHDEFLLKEFVKQWDNHNIMVRWLSVSFGYLNRYFIPRNLPTLTESGFMHFFDYVFRELMKDRKNAMLTLIAREREGEQIDRPLLKCVFEFLVEVGMGELHAYKSDFEFAMLEDTGAYYSKKAALWIEKDSCPEYMRKAEECLKREMARVGHYLHSSSEAELMEIVERELLVELSASIAHTAATIPRRKTMARRSLDCKALWKRGLSYACRHRHVSPRFQKRHVIVRDSVDPKLAIRQFLTLICLCL